MEETLGRRIMRHRKALGLTQDQLAEQLGVTAQAVSKWENDQSCPDITMLPKLSTIFGITTDQLLGSAPEQAVHQAEVVEDDEPQGVHIQKDGWDFHWDAGRRGTFSVGLFLLAVGLQLLAARILETSISFWDILWPTTLAWFGIHGFFGSFRFLKLGSLLIGVYCLLSNWSLLPFSLEGKLILPALIVLFGISLLVNALKKPHGRQFHLHHSGNIRKNDFHTDGETFSYSASFGESSQCVRLPRLDRGKISCSFGEYTVDLSDVREVSRDCLLEASVSFGELTLRVPRCYRVVQTNSTAFATFDITGQPQEEPKGLIRLKASASFGEFAVEYI